MSGSQQSVTRRIARIWLAVATTVSCLCLGEIGLRRFAAVPDPYAEFKRDALALNQFIRSEFAANYRIVTKPDGLPGVNGPGVFSTNNRGFRGDYLSTPKPPNELRVFMVGGSTTECFELAARLPGRSVRVYGAGKSGDASDDHVSMIAHRLVHLEPDVIVVFSGVNDLSKAIYGHDYLHYPRPPAGSSSLFLRMAATEFETPRHLRALWRRFRPTTQDLQQTIAATPRIREQIALQKRAPASTERPRTDASAYANNIKTIIGVASSHRIGLVLMTQQTTWNSTIDPEAKNWHGTLFRNGVNYREDYMHEALESLNDAMRGLADQNFVSLYDLARTMPKSRDYFYDDVHFTERGAATAGAVLAGLLAQTQRRAEQ